MSLLSAWRACSSDTCWTVLYVPAFVSVNKMGELFQCFHFEVRYQFNANRQNSNTVLIIKSLFGHDLGFVQLLSYRVYRVDESY